MERSFCELLPKIELHAHLNGSISIETLRELRSLNEKQGEMQLDDHTWENLEKIFLRSEIPTLSECFQIFKLAHSVTVTPEVVQTATERVIADFAKDNVVYLELRSTLRKEPKMTKRQYIESMIAGIKNCMCYLPNIIVKLIVSINRKESLEEGEENVNLAISYSKIEPDIVVGIDLSGDPNEKSFSDFTKLLTKGKREGLRLTVHFAEVPDNNEIYDVLSFKPDRLGHGTCVHESTNGSRDNWNLLLDSKIPVEVCITSNVKCKTVPSVENHHFKFLYGASHPIALSTDDKSVFHTNLSREFEIAQTTFNLSENDLWELSYKSVNHSFADENTKSKLREILISWKKDNMRQIL